MSAQNTPDRADRCIRYLTLIAAPVLADEEDPYWLDAREVDVDQYGNYCHEHGLALVEKLNAEHPEHDYFLSRGYSYESDSQEVCETCGKYLHTCLTTHAIEQELDHIESHRLGLIGKHSPWRAYMLLRVIECAQEYEGIAFHDYRDGKIAELQRRVRVVTRRIDAARRRKAAIAKATGSQP
jgi:hypothetical protein